MSNFLLQHRRLIIFLVMVPIAVFALSGCVAPQTWDARVGPLYDQGNNADNSDVPILLEVQVDWKRCGVSYMHISSVLQPPQLDNYVIDAIVPYCRIGGNFK